MIPRKWILAPAVALAMALCLPSAALAAKKKKVPTGKSWTWSFASDTLGQAPTEGLVRAGVWQVVADSSSPGDTIPPARFLRQTETDDGIAFHILQFPKPVLGDVTVSVRFRILSGEIDPSAGLMFQVDAKGRNGYLVRARASEQDLIAHYILYGKRRDIDFGKIGPLNPGVWHHLQVERIGAKLTATFDGEQRIFVRDERFRKGSIGLWAEDDTVVEFRDLEVTSR